MPVIATTSPASQNRHAAAEDARRAARAALDAQQALNAPQDAPLFAEPTPTKPQATFTIHALMDDFPFDVSFAGTADQLASTVKRLRDLGAVPPTQAARLAVEAEKERSAPVCQYHGAMKESSKAPGTWYCPQKMGDGSYCKSKG